MQATDTAVQPAGTVAAQVTLAPSQPQDIRFYLTWYMPHLMTQQQNVQALVPAPTNNVARWGTGCPGMKTSELHSHVKTHFVKKMPLSHKGQLLSHQYMVKTENIVRTP